jgi:tetratricopeptide (TPR) repeat protein
MTTRPPSGGSDRRGSRDGKPAARSGPPRSRTGSPARSTKGSRSGGSRSEGRPRSGSSAAPRRDQPARSKAAQMSERIDEDITGEELDRGTIAELRTLPEGMRETVARLLVATERNLDDNPELALEFALAAKESAARVAIIREAVGLAAYSAGNYTMALAELRAARRMTGDDEHIALMADCERALGRPRKAMELLASIAEASLSPQARIEARLVAAGARRDLGQLDAAALVLTIPELNSASTDEHIGRLRYAYADVLAELGRLDEAIQWFGRVADTDADTDAAERVAALGST